MRYINEKKMEEKKYELTDETMKRRGHVLHRIRALRDIGFNVKAGDEGGWVESERNLSQKNNCWIYHEAKAYENSCVRGQAELLLNAEVYGNACIDRFATIYEDAKVYGNARVSGDVEVYDDARVYENAQLLGTGTVCENARVHGDVRLLGEIEICSDDDIESNKDLGL